MSLLATNKNSIDPNISTTGVAASMYVAFDYGGLLKYLTTYSLMTGKLKKHM